MSRDRSKVVCSTPTEGKQPTRIERWKYDLVRAAILHALPRGGEGLEFKQLPDAVRGHLSADDLEELGSVSWYTTTVKLDLEVKGEIARAEGKGPQRLLRVG